MAGRVTEDQIKTALGDVGDIWPESVVLELNLSEGGARHRSKRLSTRNGKNGAVSRAILIFNRQGPDYGQTSQKPDRCVQSV